MGWRDDVLPLLPWFIAGLALGLMTVHFERDLWGASGGEYDLTTAQRVLLAGRAAWFYLAKLAWPTNLTFFYEQWTIDTQVWWQWVYPVTVLAVLIVAWSVRARVGRGLLAALLLFGGTLVPGLGFFNLYWHIYTYVCDHVQYLASIAIFGLVAATAATWAQRWAVTKGTRGALLAGVPVLILAAMTWQQCLVYRNLQTLYEDTIAKNPTCWMAYNNLGLVYKNQGRIDAAIGMYEKAIALKPNYDRAHYNLGVALEGTGRLDEALIALRDAIDANPLNPYPFNSMGLVFARQERLNEAVHAYKQALELHPELAAVRLNLATALGRLGRTEAARDELRTTLQTDAALAAQVRTTAEVFIARRMFDQAITFCDAVLEFEPDDRTARDLRQQAIARRSAE
jgi:tetratricopeptide (TPR) repeat protein